MAKPLVSDELWAVVAPLLPPPRPKKKIGRPRRHPDTLHADKAYDSR